MCRAIVDGGRRCDGRTRWFVNRESHDRFVPDEEQERQWHKPPALLSMTANARRTRRCRARAYAAQVEAVRVTHGLPTGEPIGPVLREELWEERARGVQISHIRQAECFQAIAADEGVPVEVISARYENLEVRPSRQREGQRLADLVTPERPDWVDPEFLVRAVEPPENRTPNPVYVRAVRDVAGVEWVLVTTYDGSEPMVWPHTQAGLKAGAWEAIQRIRAINSDADASDAYEQWLDDNDTATTDAAAPWTQQMSDGDFLAHSDGMHLT